MFQDGFALQMGQDHYGKASNRKMTKKQFMSSCKYSYLAGASGALFRILEKTKETPYQDVGELIGDIQLLYTTYGTETLEFQGRANEKITLSDMLDHMGEQ